MLPEENFPITSVQSVYPSSSDLPENLLRMYICFSGPMMPGNAYDHISLRRADGSIVEKAFLVLDEELWDSERKRFTLLFDPGRIKRDLQSNIDLGTPLQKGQRYELEIDSAWRDLHGKMLGQTVSKKFVARMAERERVSTRNWRITQPLKGSKGDLVISFDRYMDHALALKFISIIGPRGLLIGNRAMLNDTEWRFTPDQSWERGNYRIIISPLLEDVAGNNLNNVFDLDITKESRRNSVDPIELHFAIGSTTR
jgi:hypothetical protein